MKKIGLTGGIGSGKTYVAELFASLGVPVFYADAAGKQLQESDEAVRRQIKDIFGEDIYSKDGKPDRKKIASIVFSDKEKLVRLNAVIHPAVANAFREFCAENSRAAYVIKEAAILFEAGADAGLDAVITVTAPLSLRTERILRRDHITKEQAEARMKNQWSEEEKIRRAQFVIHNDGRLLLPQVVAIHEKLSS
ncbi:MAG TPA: dephospho-CoA kinase [Bacteroidia bacterium]|nr:dephospho-CoA kinase [Bacteroidia bacterium]